MVVWGAFPASSRQITGENKTLFKYLFELAMKLFYVFQPGLRGLARFDRGIQVTVEAVVFKEVAQAKHLIVVLWVVHAVSNKNLDASPGWEKRNQRKHFIMEFLGKF